MSIFASDAAYACQQGSTRPCWPARTGCARGWTSNDALGASDIEQRARVLARYGPDLKQGLDKP